MGNPIQFRVIHHHILVKRIDHIEGEETLGGKALEEVLTMVFLPNSRIRLGDIGIHNRISIHESPSRRTGRGNDPITFFIDKIQTAVDQLLSSQDMIQHRLPQNINDYKTQAFTIREIDGCNQAINRFYRQLNSGIFHIQIEF